jgi:tetratricopeptide (TPR) repeat protein
MEKLTESESLIQLKERALALAGSNSFPLEEDLAWARRLSLPKAEELLVHFDEWATSSNGLLSVRTKVCAAELAGTAMLADSKTGSWDTLPLFAFACFHASNIGAWYKALLLSERAFETVPDSPPQPRTAHDYLKIYLGLRNPIIPEYGYYCRLAMRRFWSILPVIWQDCQDIRLANEFRAQLHSGQTPTPIYILQNEYAAFVWYLNNTNHPTAVSFYCGNYIYIRDRDPSEVVFKVFCSEATLAFESLIHSIQLNINYRNEPIKDVLWKKRAQAEELSQALVAAAERRGIESLSRVKRVIETNKMLIMFEIEIQELNLLFNDGLYSKALEYYERTSTQIRELEFVGSMTYSIRHEAAASFLAAAGRSEEAENLLLRTQVDFSHSCYYMWTLGRLQFENGKLTDGIKNMRKSIEQGTNNKEVTPIQFDNITLLFAEANLAWITTQPKAEQTVHLERQEKELRTLRDKLAPDEPMRVWADVVLAENLDVQNNETEIMSILGQSSLYGPSAKTSPHFLAVRAYASKARSLWRQGNRTRALSCLRTGIEQLEDQYRNLNRQPPGVLYYWMRPWDRRWQPLYEMLFEMQLELKPAETFKILQGLVQATLADTFAGSAGIDVQRFLTPGELASWQSLLDEEELQQQWHKHVVESLQTAVGNEKDQPDQIMNAVNSSLETCYKQKKQLVEKARQRAGIPLDPGMIRRIGPQEVAKVIEKYNRAAVAQVWRLRKKAMTADNLSSLACGYRQFAGYNRQVEADGATDEDQELIVFVVTGKGLVKHFKLSSNSSKKVLTSCSKARDKTVEAFKAGSPHSDQTKEIFREAEKAEREALSIVGKELISPILKAAERPKTLFLSFPPGPLWGLAWSALPSGLFHSGFLADKVNLSFLAYAGHLNSIHQRQRQSRPNHREGCLAIGSSGGDTGSWPVELLPEAIATLPNCQREWSAIAGNKASPEALLKVSGNFDSVVFGLHNKMEDRCRSLGTFALNNGSSLSFADILSMVQFKTRYLFGGTCEGSPLESQSAFNPWVSIDFGLLENKQAYAMVGTTQKVDALDTFILALRVTELMEQEPELGLGDALRRGQKWLRSQTAPELAKYLTGINQRLLEDGDSLCSHQLEKWIGMYKDMPREHFSLARPWRGRPYPRPYSGLVHWAYYILFGAGSPPSR